MTYSPGEVAEKTGFSIDTLRYYERIGLLAHIERTSGGRRLFTDDDVQWLGTLRCLRDTGMPIARMQRYAELTRVEQTEEERLRILEEHDEEVGRRIAELEAQREHIRGKIAWYRETAALTRAADTPAADTRAAASPAPALGGSETTARV
jgi:DNA-binding transcriptional MerR regulator